MVFLWVLVVLSGCLSPQIAFEHINRVFLNDAVKRDRVSFLPSGFSIRVTDTWHPDVKKASLYYDDIRVHLAELKFSGSSVFESEWLLGHWPFLNQQSSIYRRVYSPHHLRSVIHKHFHVSLDQCHFSSFVYVHTQEGFHPACEFLCHTPRGIWRVFVSAWDQSILIASPVSLHVDPPFQGEVLSGSVQLYARGKGSFVYDGDGKKALDTPSTVVLDDLIVPQDTRCMLHGRLIRIYNCMDFQLSNPSKNMYFEHDSGRCVPRLRGDVLNNECHFSPAPVYDSSSYDEAMAYWSIHEAMEWHRRFLSDDQKKYRDFGFTDKNPLKVYVQVHFGGEVENAYYSRDSLDHPNGFIRIGPGYPMYQKPQKDRKVLRNLGKDADVYAHEFGHHLVYRSIANYATNQAVTVHEAYADLFVYLMRGGVCLAKSVVKASGHECLRRADKDGKVKDYYDANVHIAGEELSSSLWRVYEAFMNLSPLMVKRSLKKCSGIVWIFYQMKRVCIMCLWL